MAVYLKPLLAVVLALCLLSGCQKDESVVSVAKKPAVEQAPPTASPQAPPEAADEAATLEENSLLQAMANYEAPFPNRREMFVPPKSGPAPRASSEGEADVQLKGLVDVDEPRAILDIEGATALLAVNGEKYGVKVISIDDMKVVLERGRTRWTASLE